MFGKPRVHEGAATGDNDGRDARPTLRQRVKEFREKIPEIREDLYAKYINVVKFPLIHARRSELEKLGFRLLKWKDNEYIVQDENVEFAGLSKKEFSTLVAILGQLKPEGTSLYPAYQLPYDTEREQFSYLSAHDLKMLKEYNLLIPEDVPRALSGKEARSVSIKEWTTVREEFIRDKLIPPETDPNEWDDETTRDMFLYGLSYRLSDAAWEQFKAKAGYLSRFLNGHPQTVFGSWYEEKMSMFIDHAEEFLPHFSQGTFNILLYTLLERQPQTISTLLTKEMPKQFKIPEHLRLAGMFASSPVREVQDLAVEFASQMRAQGIPEREVGQVKEMIEEVFLRNHIPFVGKQYRIFTLLQEYFLANEYRHLSSPSLAKQVKNRDRFNSIIFKDLLTISLLSDEPTLHDFLLLFKNCRPILEKKAKGVTLSDFEAAELESFLESLTAIRMNPTDKRSMLGRKGQGYDALLKEYGCRPGESLIARVESMFLRHIGIRTVEEALAIMQNRNRIAEERNRGFANNPRLSANDMAKGVGSQYFKTSLNIGWTSPEFVGAFHRDQDQTPFDVDMVYVGAEGWEGLRTSAAAGYGDMIVLFSDSGKFQEKPDGSLGSYERFGQSVVKNHVGIRTGIASSEAMGIVVSEALVYHPDRVNEIKNAIAAKGLYIPIFNHGRELLFSYKEYQERRAPYIEAENAGQKLRRHGLKDALSADTVDVTAIIKMFEDAMPEAYAGDTGTGYILSEHISRIMTQFEIYGKDMLPAGVPVWLVRAMALLSDAGKPIAVRFARNKDEQHGFNRDVARAFMNESGFSNAEKDFVTELVSHDPIGEYMKGEIDTQTASRELIQMARKAGMPAKTFAETCFAYYYCDASAYEGLAYLFDFENKRMAPAYEEKRRQLMAAVAG